MNVSLGDIPMPASAEHQVLAPDQAERPRVLLVDDDERNLLAVSSILDDLGEVVSARSGEEALRHLLKGEFAVILLDVYMPGMDGYETARRIREQAGSGKVVLTALTGWGQQEDRRRTAEAGFDYHLVKPPEPDALQDVLAKLNCVQDR